MNIIDFKETNVPISSNIQNAYINFSHMDVSLLALVTDIKRNGKPIVGYGFNSNGRYAQSWLLKERFLPRLSQASPTEILNDEGNNFDPSKIWDILMTNEKPGGHGERSVAVGIIDMAMWDLVAKIEEKPLYQLLSERYNNGNYDSKIFVYAAGGYYYPGKDLLQLENEIKRYLDLGFTVVKIKVGGVSLKEDLQRIDKVLSLLGKDQKLAVDANGRFDLETAKTYAEMLSEFDLMWYEEAGDPLDFEMQRELCQYYDGAMATGENLFSFQDTRNLIRYAGLRPEKDFLQFDCALSYGLVEYLRILEMLKAHNWSLRRLIPHGGHQLSSHICAGLGLGGNEAYPEVFTPFGNFPDNYIVEDGHIRLTETPGIGFENISELYQLMQDLA
ncbi:TPA: mandelate racemase [Candidatus Poribacteria bacterium]|nr:mandelate racemase [Candidatus Poribacteria bacterium]HIB87191.1 mandelate racemase [Candidatus Poribacteria bacterium]HIB99673.1 mandelate racemase [Candidatus Poribacteria bacterium]HIC20120.1 mandelate racemase [Candidatus Poribacteria bacterium]HIO09979.1 mandelate racemase [Candidatus Poribacteria bacterium]